MPALKFLRQSMMPMLALAGLIMIAPVSHAAGQQVYMTRCSMCHQKTGAGVPGQFPQLSGRAGIIASSKPGRAYLIKVMLFGLFGAIKVGNTPYTGVMPSMGSLSDQDIADTLNYIVSLEKPKKAVADFTAAEVKAIRNDGKLAGSAVGKERASLAAKGLIP